MDKAVYNIIQTAITNTNAFRNKELFFQYVALLYVGGKRRIEPFLRPVTIIKQEVNGKTYYAITSIAAKHYEGQGRSRQALKECQRCQVLVKSKKERKDHHLSTGHNHFVIIGARRLTTHYWRAEAPHEKALFEFLLRGRAQITIDFLPLLPKRVFGKDIKRVLEKYSPENGNIFNGITIRFEMLKAKITDGREEYTSSLVPHMLRHMRAYDLLVNHEYKPQFIQRLMDWDKSDMPFYYGDISEMLKQKEELAWYEQNNNVG